MIYVKFDIIWLYLGIRKMNRFFLFDLIERLDQTVDMLKGFCNLENTGLSPTTLFIVVTPIQLHNIRKG